MSSRISRRCSGDVSAQACSKSYSKPVKVCGQALAGTTRTSPCRPPAPRACISGFSSAARIAACERTPSVEPTLSAIVWITWIPVAPMPTTPTRLPARSTGSFGHFAVKSELALERLLPGEDRRQRRREHAAAGDEELRVDRLALVGRERPAAGLLVEAGARDRRVEHDVLAQVETVGDVVQPALDLRLAGEFLAPAPALVEILGEQVLVDVAFGIEPRAGIAVPVPGAADVGGGCRTPSPQALLRKRCSW